MEVKYQNIIKKHKFTIFRDYNSKINDEIDQEFNNYALLLGKLQAVYTAIGLVNLLYNPLFIFLYSLISNDLNIGFL